MNINVRTRRFWRHKCRQSELSGNVVTHVCPTPGGGGGNWGGDRELQETPDTVFISGLSSNIEEDDLLAHFGSIGVIKVTLGCR